MKLSEVQTRIQTLLAARPSLAALVPALVEDGVTDLEEPILQALQTKGACIVLGDVAAAVADRAFPDPRAAGKAAIPVFVYDNPGVAHTPAGLVLIEEVFAAILQNKLFEVTQLERFTTEKGSALAVCECEAQVEFGP